MFPARTQRLGVARSVGVSAPSLTPVCPGPEEPPHGVLSIALSVGIGECPVMSNFGLSPNSFLICILFFLCSFYPGRHVPVPYLVCDPQQKTTFLMPFESGFRLSSFGERRIQFSFHN